MTVFLDDMSMPEPNTWGDQPTLELVRQLLETGGVYFLSQDRRGELKSIEDLQVCPVVTHARLLLLLCVDLGSLRACLTTL
jgi:dynein heavy chain